MSAFARKQTLRSATGMSAKCQSRHSGGFWVLSLVGKGAQVRGASPVKLPRRKFLRLAAGAAALPAMSRIARAETYPSRPVRIIVGYAAGEPPDLWALLEAQWLSGRLKKSFSTDTRPGAARNT